MVMTILKIYLEEHLLIKYYAIKHLILLKFRNMMDINAELPQWFINVLMKGLLVVMLKAKLLHKPIIKKKLRNETSTHLLKTILGLLN